MPEQAVAIESKPLSQTERVVDTFLAPSRTFVDVLRDASWWLPYVLIVLGALVLTAAIQQKVGWTQLVENEIRSNPKLTERLSNAQPEQLAAAHKAMQYSFMGTFYASPMVNLASLALMAVVLWPTINFGFGGSATYGRVLCVVVYAWLPNMLSALLAAVMLFAGRSPDSFTTQSMLGSNVGYYIETPGALKTFLSSVDLFAIWTAVLLSIGLAIVARTKRSAGYLAVFGWWLLIVLARSAIAAFQS